MKFNIFMICLLSFLAITCNNTDNPTETSKDPIVTGFLKFRNQPLTNASVQIDDVLNWKTVTDQNGYFEIENVSKGDHILKTFKSIEDNKTISSSSSIVVSDGTIQLGEIRLPEPPELYEIDKGDVTVNSVKLRWSRSFDTEFREYKIYRKEDAGIDETTGQLIYVNTNQADTTFVDSSFVAGLHYFYRVYILSSFGKMGGSNVVNIQTPTESLLLNGNFEEQAIDSTSIPNWRIGYGTFKLDSLTVYKGNYSLKATRKAEDPPHYDYRIFQQISAANFLDNKTYNFSLMMKSSQNTSLSAVLYYMNPYYREISPVLNISENTNWKEISTIFAVPDEANTVFVELRIFNLSSSGPDAIGWFDDIKIKIK